MEFNQQFLAMQMQTGHAHWNAIANWICNLHSMQMRSELHWNANVELSFRFVSPSSSSLLKSLSIFRVPKETLVEILKGPKRDPKETLKRSLETPYKCESKSFEKSKCSHTIGSLLGPP
jgi:hypothetical protein